jgi:hypothetical protein
MNHHPFQILPALCLFAAAIAPAAVRYGKGVKPEWRLSRVENIFVQGFAAMRIG